MHLYSLFQQKWKLRKLIVVLILLLDYINQSGWGMLVSLKGCHFEHTELSIHFETFNDECAIVKEAQDAYLLSQETKLTRVNLQMN